MYAGGGGVGPPVAAPQEPGQLALEVPEALRQSLPRLKGWPMGPLDRPEEVNHRSLQVLGAGSLCDEGQEQVPSLRDRDFPFIDFEALEFPSRPARPPEGVLHEAGDEGEHPGGRDLVPDREVPAADVEDEAPVRVDEEEVRR